MALKESAYRVTRITLAEIRTDQVDTARGTYPTLNVSKQNRKFTKGIERAPNACRPMSA